MRVAVLGDLNGGVVLESFVSTLGNRLVLSEERSRRAETKSIETTTKVRLRAVTTIVADMVKPVAIANSRPPGQAAT